MKVFEPFYVYVVLCSKEYEVGESNEYIEAVYLNEAAAIHHTDTANEPQPLADGLESSWWYEEHEVI